MLVGVTAQSDTPVSRCFQFTWLGPRWNNESIFLNATCSDATRLSSGVPCFQPLVVSYDGTWPDVNYIWANHGEDASCILANNDVCATYTYYFDGHVENSTYMCTRAVDSNDQAISSGCYTQTNGSYATRACFCRSIPGGLPCNVTMYSMLTRGNAILTYTLSVLACLTFLCFLSTLTVDYRTAAQMNTVKVVVKNVPDYGASRERNDLGFLTFDLKTDLSHLFNWNVKQLFLYLTAEYITPNNELNQVVLWDKIILRGENALLDFKNMNTKYYFWDDGNGL
ncbi:Signal peptidase complex subunit 3, partial [Operophtera brumata]